MEVEHVEPPHAMKKSPLLHVLLLMAIWSVHQTSSAAPSPPLNFAVEDVLVGVEQPMAIRFFPDGRMLLLQKKGPVRIVSVTGNPIQSDLYMDLDAPTHSDGLESDQERGILDVAVDPGFPAAPYVYLLYTSASGPNGARLRVARFSHVENSGGVTSRGNPASELILWQDTDGYDSCCHYGGGLDFGPDGNLWLTTGEHFQGSYSTSLQKAGGKVHRFTSTGSIPSGNPYDDGNGPNVDSTFAYGLRNPFRARWDLASGRFFIAEVGGNTQSTAWEDLHVIRFDSLTGRFVDNDFGTFADNGQYNGINFGWPTVEGPPPHTDFPGANIDSVVGEPIYAYKHQGITAAINGGVVYWANQFPTEFQGAYFFADSTRDFIRYLKFNPDGSIAPNPNPGSITDQNPDNISRPFDLDPVGRIVCLEVGPDGALYYVSFTDSGGAYGQPNPAVLGAVRRYVYDNGNARPEILNFSATPSNGPSPLTVNFLIEATDPEGDPMSYVLDFGDGVTVGPQPLADNLPVTMSHTYQFDGTYEARLEVSDASHSAVELLDIDVGTAPVINSLVSTNSRPGSSNTMFRFGDTITFSASATDAEDGVLGGLNFSWSIVFVRPGNTHPAFGPQSGTTSIDFPIPSQGQGFSGPVYYRCFLTATDSSGLSTSLSIDLFPEKSDITFDTVPSGIVVQVDGNTAQPTPFVLDTLINFNHVVTVPPLQCLGGSQYDFTNWSNGPESVQQIYNVPATNSSLTGFYVTSGACLLPPEPGLVLHLIGEAGVTLNGQSVLIWEAMTC
jgi:glucose/arabinose dehydrogenase